MTLTKSSRHTSRVFNFRSALSSALARADPKVPPDLFFAGGNRGFGLSVAEESAFAATPDAVAPDGSIFLFAARNGRLLWRDTPWNPPSGPCPVSLFGSEPGGPFMAAAERRNTRTWRRLSSERRLNGHPPGLTALPPGWKSALKAPHVPVLDGRGNDRRNQRSCCSGYFRLALRGLLPARVWGLAALGSHTGGRGRGASHGRWNRSRSDPPRSLRGQLVGNRGCAARPRLLCLVHGARARGRGCEPEGAPVLDEANRRREDQRGPGFAGA